MNFTVPYIWQQHSRRAGWNLRDVFRGVLAISRLLESISTQSWPLDPALRSQLSHGRALWVGSHREAGGVSRVAFPMDVCLLGKKTATAGIHWASILEAALQQVPNHPRCWNSSKRQHWWVSAKPFVALLSVGICSTLQECESRLPMSFSMNFAGIYWRGSLWLLMPLRVQSWLTRCPSDTERQLPLLKRPSVPVRQLPRRSEDVAFVYAHQEGGQALAQASWRGDRCPKPGSVCEAAGQCL